MINADQVLSFRSYAASTLMHEFTHMVNWYQRAISRNLTSFETWLEEMSAMMTEDIVTLTVTPDHYAKIGDARIRPYVQTGGAVSLINWTNLSSGSYGLGGSLGAFLNRRYGLNIYMNLLDCSGTANNWSCVDGLIKANGGTGYDDEFSRCGVTVFGLFPGTGLPAGYGYPAVTLSGFALPVYDVSAYSSYRPATAASLGATFEATSQTYSADTIIGTTYSRTSVVVPAKSTLLLSIQ